MMSSCPQNDDLTERAPAPATVFTYTSSSASFSREHEVATRRTLAQSIALLNGMAFGGEYEPGGAVGGRMFLVPSDTLTVSGRLQTFGIRSEADFFGGAVPHPFVATKAITHPLLHPESARPMGWSPSFGAHVKESVLAGFTDFSKADAREALERLLLEGPARVKPVRATGGRGQTVVDEASQIDVVLDSLAEEDIVHHGVALEENLTAIQTFSIGMVRLGGVTTSYVGVQGLTESNTGDLVYGGSDLTCVRGDFNKLARYDLDVAQRRALAQARLYDAFVSICCPGFMASRRNYDVALGRAASGEWVSGVLEQSWRLGGASGAEIEAVSHFAEQPDLQVVRASTVVRYGPHEVPPSSRVLYRGYDGEAGEMIKYVQVT
jgi:hypothetical protein